MEYRRDPVRRHVAEERIARWLEVSRTTAAETFRAALRSEALEEADSARCMRGAVALDQMVSIEGITPCSGRPRLYAALHAGSPVLAYLGVQRQLEPDVRVIARELDDANPMPRAKRAFAMRKVAWCEQTGAPFLDTDGTAVVRAREHLIQGKPLFAAVDVPGDVVTRSDRRQLFGEAVYLAAGIFRLAAMARADVQMTMSIHREGRILVRALPPLERDDAASLGDAVVAQMESVIREWPSEWWLWPYVVTDSAGR